MKTKFLLYLSLFVAIAANKWVASCLIPKSMVMKRKSILINLTTIILLLIGVNVSATNYTLPRVVLRSQLLDHILLAVRGRVRFI